MSAREWREKRILPDSLRVVGGHVDYDSLAHEYARLNSMGLLQAEREIAGFWDCPDLVEDGKSQVATGMCSKAIGER